MPEVQFVRSVAVVLGRFVVVPDKFAEEFVEKLYKHGMVANTCMR